MRIWNALLAVLAPAMLAGPAHADDIDDYVRATMASQKIPGLTIGLATGAENSKVRSYSAVRTYGLSNLELDVPVRATTVFQSASVGKQFTAAGVLLLVQDGRIDLDDPISKFFPGDKPRWRDITLRHLLTHTSGLPDYTEKDIDMRRDYTEDELVAWAVKQDPVFVPGANWQYSNTGYLVLGALIRKVTGQFYGDMLRDRIFKPAGMTTTRVISEADVIANRADGYELVDGVVKNQFWVAPSLNTTADGALYLSVRDLLEWDDALRSRRLFTAATYESMWTPVAIGNGLHYPYGMGWFIGEQRGSQLIEHTGSWQGFRSYIGRYVARGVSVVVLCNLDVCDAGTIGHEIAGRLDPMLRLPDPKKPGNDPRPDRTNGLRAALAAWAKGEQHPMLSTIFAAPAALWRSTDTRESFAKRLPESIGFTYLAEDEVRGRGFERNGSPVDRIVYCSLVMPNAAQVIRLYVDAKDTLIDIDE